jgi:hypothetical protein
METVNRAQGTGNSSTLGYENNSFDRIKFPIPVSNLNLVGNINKRLFEVENFWVVKLCSDAVGFQQIEVRG